MKQKFKREKDNQAVVSKQIATQLAKQYSEGKAEGEVKERYKIAYAMLEEGADLNFICKVTNLTVEEITRHNKK